MNIKELKEKIKCFKISIKNIKENELIPVEEKLSIANQKLAEALCFCKVGDKIQDGLGECFIVSKIYLKYNDHYGLRAHKLKKNGDKYKYDGDLYNWHDKWDNWKVVS